MKRLAKESGGEVIFVSHDKNDFSAKEGGGLHPDLICDLREADLNEDQITLITKECCLRWSKRSLPLRKQR